jgi:hypothetical protein
VPEEGAGSFVSRLRTLALEELKHQYQPDHGLFVFRLGRGPHGVVKQGISRRYTAITAIGLVGERAEDVQAVLAGRSLEVLGDRLHEDVGTLDNLGDVALTLWAGILMRHPSRERALDRLLALRPLEGARFTVELAWALAALSLEPAARSHDLRDQLAARLRDALNAETGVFPHVVGRTPSLRAHVACFADLVYPIQALSFHSRATEDKKSLSAAERCAERICRVQGAAGQWWWHYDVRTGRVIEPYPVYAVHQDGMGPMALFALREAGGRDFGDSVRRGLDWLEASPELGGGSLVDPRLGIIWRKVARREPGKLSRSLQALASRVSPAFRVPGLDAVFPPRVVDWESRPYHMGWLLYAFPREAGNRW